MSILLLTKSVTCATIDLSPSEGLDFDVTYQYAIERKWYFLSIQQDRSELFRLPVTKEHRRYWGDSWYRAGVIVTNDRGEFLLVEELRARINGAWYDVQDMWNVPSGSCREDERIIDAAIREAREELGRGVKLIGLCAIKQGHHNDDPAVTFIFAAELTGETYDFNHKEIKSQRYFSESAIYDLNNQGKLRSADLVLQTVQNYQRGLIVPLELFNHYER